MAHVIVIGAGLGGIPATFDLRKHLPKDHRVTLIGARPYFAGSLTPIYETYVLKALGILSLKQRAN